LVLAFVLVSSASFAEEARNSVFVLSPVGGWITNKSVYTVQGSTAEKSLKETGNLYGLFMTYADRSLSVGSLGHYSDLEKSRENSYMFYVNYYFMPDSALRPMAGMAMDYISFQTELPNAEVAPLLSMDLASSIWAFHPTAGVAYRAGPVRVTPFAGYFNERFLMTMNCPGMKVGTKTLAGFRQEVRVVTDYATTGARVELDPWHFLKLDSRFYFRFHSGEKMLFTTRNRLDIYLTRNFGLSVKCDYFKDPAETNFYILGGPALAL
jgi:outer membrane protein W